MSMYPQILKGRYQLEDILGEGGMGTVYRCVDPRSGRLGAVKFLTLEQILSESGMRRFEHECHLLSSFNHPNIVKILDHGVEEGFPYLVMELCVNARGVPYTLKHLQMEQPKRRLSPELLLGLLPAILDSVGQIHLAGLVHRDIKPDNILLHFAPDGRIVPKLTDFGLVAVTGDDELRQQFQLTIDVSMQDSSRRNKSFVGTYTYMSPEQKRGDLLDARSDVYSLGLMIYRMATGYERLNPELPSDVDPEFPEWLDELVEYALDEDPEGRFPSALAMYEALPEEMRDAHRDWCMLNHWTPIDGSLIDSNRDFDAEADADAEGDNTVRRGTVLSSTAGTPAAAPATPGNAAGASAAGTGAAAVPGRASGDTPAAVASPARPMSPLAAAFASAVATANATAAKRGDASRTAMADLDDALEFNEEDPVGSIMDDLDFVSSAISGQDSQELAELEELALLARDSRQGGNSEADEDLQDLIGKALATVENARRRLQLDAPPAPVAPPAPTPPSARRVPTPLPVAPAAKSGDAGSRKASSGITRVGAGTLSSKFDGGATAAPGASGEARSFGPTGTQKMARIDISAVPKLVEAYESGDAQQRQIAIRNLNRYGSGEVPALIDLFVSDDPQARHAAVVLIQLIGEPAVAPLIQTLKNRDEQVRILAVEALGRIGDVAIPSLVQSLINKSPTVREAAVIALGKMNSIAASSALLSSLRDQDPSVRAAAVEALSGMEDREDIGAALEGAKSGPRKPGSSGLPAAAPASRLPPQGAPRSVARADAVPPVVPTTIIPTAAEAELRHSDPKVRMESVERLGREKPAHAAATLILALKDDNWRVRGAAVNAIKEVGDVAIPQLVAAMRNEEWSVRCNLVETLGKIGGDRAAAPLIGASRDPDAGVRKAAAEALAKGGTAQFKSSVAIQLANSDPVIRREAVEALDKVNFQGSLGALVSLLQDPDWSVRAAAATALGHMPEVGLTIALKVAANDRTEAVSGLARQVLEKLTKLDPVDTLVDALDDRDWRVRVAVTDTLLAFGESIASRLAEAAQTRDEVIRTAVTEIIDRLKERRSNHPTR